MAKLVQSPTAVPNPLPDRVGRANKPAIIATQPTPPPQREKRVEKRHRTEPTRPHAPLGCPKSPEAERGSLSPLPHIPGRPRTTFNLSKSQPPGRLSNRELIPEYEFSDEEFSARVLRMPELARRVMADGGKTYICLANLTDKACKEQELKVQKGEDWTN